MELEWAIGHFPVLGHDTGDCIVTQGLGGRAGVRSRRCDTASRATTRPGCARSERQGMRAACPLGCVAIQYFVSWRRDGLCVATRPAIRCPTPCDTAQERCNMRGSARDTASDTTGGGHDTAPSVP